MVSGKWRLLTGGRDTIFWLARDSYFVDVEESTGDGFFHSETFVLLDAQRRIRGVYNGTKEFEMKQLIQDIGTLLSAGRA